MGAVKVKVLDLCEKLKDKIIKECILGFETLTPEDQLILLEEYCNNYNEKIDIEELRESLKEKEEREKEIKEAK